MTHVMKCSVVGFFRAVMVVWAILSGTVASPAVAGETHRGATTNFVELNLFRADTSFWPSSEFVVDVGVTIQGVPGVTSVLVSSTGGVSAQLETGDGVFWVWNQGFADLASMTSTMHGDWTVTINGSSPSTSTFSFNAGALLDSDFFATPTDVFPPDGSSGVPPDVIFTWSDPTGPMTPDALAVFVGNETGEQEDNSIFGTLNVTDTSWDPPLDLNPGEYEFGVFYANIGDAGLVSPVTVTSGTIVWDNSPFAPDGYPASTPLLILGSDTTVVFQVGSVCAADLDGDGSIGILDLLALLAAWGTDPGGPPDFDGDGTVGILDLLTLLSNWGPCP